MSGLLGTAVLLTIPALSGCDFVQAYFDGTDVLEIDASGEPGEHPLFPYFVQSEFEIDYAPPDDDFLASQPDDPDAEPNARDPWIKADDLDISIQWTLTNPTDQEVTAWVMLDGATEFYDWNPIDMYGIAGGEDAEEIAFPSLVGYFPRDIGPNQVLEGEFREDDLREAAFDLDVLTRFCGGPLALVYNRHEVEDAGTDYLPEDADIAGFYMLRLTLAASVPLKLEYSVRIRDRDEKLFDAGSPDYDTRYVAQPELYVPAGLAMVAPDEEDPGVLTEYCADATGANMMDPP